MIPIKIYIYMYLDKSYWFFSYSFGKWVLLFIGQPTRSSLTREIAVIFTSETGEKVSAIYALDEMLIFLFDFRQAAQQQLLSRPHFEEDQQAHQTTELSAIPNPWELLVKECPSSCFLTFKSASKDMLQYRREPPSNILTKASYSSP